MATEEDTTTIESINTSQPTLPSRTVLQEELSPELEHNPYDSVAPVVRQRRKTFLPAKLRQFMYSDERFWSTGILSFIVPIPIFLMGFTIAYPSNATLDLSEEATELPKDYLLSQALLSLFAVSI